MSIKNSNDTFGKRTLNLPAYSAVPQATAPPSALYFSWKMFKNRNICGGCCIDWHVNVNINLLEPSEIQWLKLKLGVKIFLGNEKTVYLKTQSV